MKNEEVVTKKLVHELTFSTMHVSHFLKVFISADRCDHRHCLFHLVVSDHYSGDWAGQLVDGRESKIIHVSADKAGNFDVFLDDESEDEDE